MPDYKLLIKLINCAEKRNNTIDKLESLIHFC